MTKEELKSSKIFLSEAHLKGYKSVVDSKVTFHPNLNIIIGKNGSGKSNFIDFLYKALVQDYTDMFNFESEITLDNSDNKQLTLSVSKKNIERSNNTFSLSPLEYKAVLKEGTKKIDLKKSPQVEFYLEEQNFNFATINIRHGVPDNYLLVDKPLSFVVNQLDFIFGNNKINSYFVKTLIEPFFLTRTLESLDEYRILLFGHIKKSLLKIKEVLEILTNIQDIRLNNHFIIFFEKNSYTIKNLFLEFKIDNLWLPFSSLSDGTKRLFYIVSEILSAKNIIIKINSLTTTNFSFNKIILLEEPELGIHPNTLKLLLDFLKEESRENQIIITTHAPQTLDILDEGELDQIIISSLNTKKGTEFKHLNNTQKKKAKEFMKNQFLSDYWRFSDLNR